MIRTIRTRYLADFKASLARDTISDKLTLAELSKTAWRATENTNRLSPSPPATPESTTHKGLTEDRTQSHAKREQISASPATTTEGAETGSTVQTNRSKSSPLSCRLMCSCPPRLTGTHMVRPSNCTKASMILSSPALSPAAFWVFAKVTVKSSAPALPSSSSSPPLPINSLRPLLPSSVSAPLPPKASSIRLTITPF